MNFKDLGLGPDILKAIDECGYKTPTPIQEQAIPHVLMTRDVVGLAQTGTGKTAGFILPMIEILYGGRAKARMPRSLVLSPTRELAAQIAENFDTYGKYHKLTKALLTGGTSMGEQIKLLDRGVDVLIATPGRLLDLFERGNVLLNDIKILVIDEADRMLDMGFIPDIEKIVSLVPPIRQTLLFSATMPPEIKKLADKFLSNPKQVSVAAVSSSAETVEQKLVWTDPRRKQEKLNKILKLEDVKNAFVFCNRKKDIGDLARFLERQGYNVAPMHGDMPQSQRTQTLDAFKDDKITLLVCSDVAARGLDVPAVSHVFNYDVPMNAEDYVHRIGRTGRAGLEGRSWTLATKSDSKFVAAIERLTKGSIETVDLDKSGSGGGKDNAGDDKKKSGRQGGRSEKPSRDKKTDRQGKEREKQQSSPKSRKSGQPEKNKRPSSNAPDSFGDDVPAFLRRK